MRLALLALLVLAVAQELDKEVEKFVERFEPTPNKWPRPSEPAFKLLSKEDQRKARREHLKRFNKKRRIGRANWRRRRDTNSIVMLKDSPIAKPLTAEQRQWIKKIFAPFALVASPDLDPEKVQRDAKAKRMKGMSEFFIGVLRSTVSMFGTPAKARSGEMFPQDALVSCTTGVCRVRNIWRERFSLIHANDLLRRFRSRWVKDFPRVSGSELKEVLPPGLTHEGDGHIFVQITLARPFATFNRALPRVAAFAALYGLVIVTCIILFVMSLFSVGISFWRENLRAFVLGTVFVGSALLVAMWTIIALAGFAEDNGPTSQPLTRISFVLLERFGAICFVAALGMFAWVLIRAVLEGDDDASKFVSAASIGIFAVSFLCLAYAITMAIVGAKAIPNRFVYDASAIVLASLSLALSVLVVAVFARLILPGRLESDAQRRRVSIFFACSLLLAALLVTRLVLTVLFEFQNIQLEAAKYVLDAVCNMYSATLICIWLGIPVIGGLWNSHKPTRNDSYLELRDDDNADRVPSMYDL